MRFDSDMLLAMFKMIGNVQKAHVENSGRGVVVMTTNQEAQDCVHYFNGQLKEGLSLVVQVELPAVQRPTAFKTFQKRPDFFKKTQRNLTRKVAGDMV